MTATRVRTALYALSTLVLAAIACIVGAAGGTWWSMVLFGCAAITADAAGLAHDLGLRLRARTVRTAPGTAREDALVLALDVAQQENEALQKELRRANGARDAARRSCRAADRIARDYLTKWGRAEAVIVRAYHLLDTPAMPGYVDAAELRAVLDNHLDRRPTWCVPGPHDQCPVCVSAANTWKDRT
ncbi:hypothetical protein ACFV0C_36915 [Streptomyces sp. NPDC059568]|uniref:hypothetical protein n=1 Tax=Streptomyces sp. NPDC059568 TaxID=3346868 RepID=UPI0036BF3B85